MTQAAQSLYEQDFVRWIDEQARALRDARRSGANLPIDWENLAEEVETLGRSQRQELRSRLRTILIHLLKLQISPASDPRAKWKSTVERERVEVIKGVLLTSPSLRRDVATLIADETSDAARLAANDLARFGELSEAAQSKIAAAGYTENQVLGDWFPPEP